MFTYKTIREPATAQYRVLGSRHLGFIFPVNDEEEIKKHIDALWKDYHDATHICYAWRLGWEKKHYRINDDGEPSGTAGKPIFGQIQSFDITNVLIAVVRYFGGTKLGTGGLIDAYKTAARLCIESAGVVEQPVMVRYAIQFAYSQMPAVMKMLKELGMQKLHSEMSDICTMEFLLEYHLEARLQACIADLKDIKLTQLGMM